MEEDGGVVIDIKQINLNFEISHQQKVEDKEINRDIKAIKEISENGLLSPFCCIYRVPPMIRHLNEKAYTPQVVSIGPYHHCNKSLMEMKMHKLIMFKRFVERAMTDLDSLVNFAEQSEPKVRASYFESVDYGKKDFVKLILVDAAFIIQLFMIDGGGNRFDDLEDAKLSHSWMRQAIFEDLLLLENQLPFFFLKELYDIAFPIEIRGYYFPSFLELTYSFFQSRNNQYLEHDLHIKHFTDLLRLFYLPRTKPGRVQFKGDESDILRYSANELREAGVKLKKTKGQCLLELKFSGSVLEIPQICVEDTTETYFRNMIALEQCHYPEKSYITDYIFIMDSIVNTSKDVEVLSHKKIINNLLGDASEVATLFNGLGKHTTQSNFNVEYRDICERLNTFHDDCLPQSRATLRRDYFNTPWQTVATIAGIMLLILTLIQTVFSILQVVLKP